MQIDATTTRSSGGKALFLQSVKFMGPKLMVNWIKTTQIAVAAAIDTVRWCLQCQQLRQEVGWGVIS